MVVLTFVYVVATIVIVYFTRKSVTTAIELENNRLRPYVVFNISSSTATHMTFASIRNLGLTAAYNVTVTLQPELAGVRGEPSSLTAHTILFMPPREEITDIIDFSPSFFQKYDKPLFEGAVKYENRAGDIFDEPFRIDLTVFKRRTFIRDPVPEELKKINETLTAISQKLEVVSAALADDET